tara:strand:+ start:153224 stop:154105 length:882 start_codon:yes stop_codon:yes gene_type:complete
VDGLDKIGEGRTVNDINTGDIEKYQILLQENPRSKVFAPLAEAYRKMKMLNEAAEIAELGIKYNPDFAGGRVVMAKILMEREDYSQAIEELKKATALSPENILAYQLLAENHLAEKQTKEALKAYKMVLFLNPQHTRARNAVLKLESLTADEYEEELFSMTKLTPLEQTQSRTSETITSAPPPPPSTKGNTLLDRHLSLVDAFVARNEIDKARNAIIYAEEELGPVPEIIKRKQLIFRNNTFERYENPPEPIASIPPTQVVTEEEITLGENLEDPRTSQLEELLERFEAYAES